MPPMFPMLYRLENWVGLVPIAAPLFDPKYADWTSTGVMLGVDMKPGALPGGL